MSYSALYHMTKGADYRTQCEPFAEYKNSWGFGLMVWKTLWERHCAADPAEPFNLFYNCDDVWNLPHSGKMESFEMFVLMSTFDGAVMQSHTLEKLATFYEEFTSSYASALGGKIWHGVEIAKDLRILLEEHPGEDACFMVNSVSGIGIHEPWYIEDGIASLKIKT